MRHINELLNGSFLFSQVDRKVLLHLNIFLMQDQLREFDLQNLVGVSIAFPGISDLPFRSQLYFLRT